MKLKNGFDNEQVDTHFNAILLCNQLHTPFFIFKKNKSFFKNNFVVVNLVIYLQPDWRNLFN